MLPSFILALREGIEAALIIGIALGVLRKMDRRDLNPMIWIGVISASLLSLLIAVGLFWVGAEFTGQGEQLFEGGTMLLAAGILTWLIFWMQNQNSAIQQTLKNGIQQTTTHQGGQKALFFLAFIAVIREGVELAIFLLAAQLTSNPLQEVLGASLGITLALLLGWLFFNTSHRLGLQRFFQTTNILLVLFAAGLVGLGIHEFNEVGLIPAFIAHVWNLGALLPDESTPGQLLKALLGYDSSPSLSQTGAYLGYFALLGILMMIKRIKGQNNKQPVEKV
jgi:high-affinity iron transporter